MTGGEWPAFVIAQSNDTGLSAREYASIHLCVPDSGKDWLDEMIRKARRDRFAAAAMAGMLHSNYLISDTTLGAEAFSAADKAVNETPDSAAPLQEYE